MWNKKKFFQHQFYFNQHEFVIKSFYIPSQVKQINKNVFKKCNKFQIIELGEKSELEYFDLKMLIANKEKILLMIPNKLKKIICFIRID